MKTIADDSLGLLELRLTPACANTNEHLHEFGSRNAEERHPGLTRGRPGHCFSRAGRTNEQYATRQSGAELVIFARVSRSRRLRSARAWLLPRPPHQRTSPAGARDHVVAPCCAQIRRHSADRGSSAGRRRSRGRGTAGMEETEEQSRPKRATRGFTLDHHALRGKQVDRLLIVASAQSRDRCLQRVVEVVELRPPTIRQCADLRYPEYLLRARPGSRWAHRLVGVPASIWLTTTE